MIRISFLFHYQNSLPFVLDAFFTTKECEAASHPEVRYTPMCTDGASLDAELEEGEWGGRHFSAFSIQVVKDDKGLHIRSYEVPRIAFVRRGEGGGLSCEGKRRPFASWCCSCVGEALKAGEGR